MKLSNKIWISIFIIIFITSTSYSITASSSFLKTENYNSNRELTKTEVKANKSPNANAPITTAGSVSSCPNGSFNIPVTVSNFTQIYAVTLRLDFDTTLLNYNGYSNVNTLFSGMYISISNESGSIKKIKIAWADLNPVTLSNGSKIIDLNFTLKSGSPTLSFNNVANSGGDCEYANLLGVAHNDSPTSTYYINSTITNLGVATPGSITGQTAVCKGLNNVAYSITAIPNASSYTWTLPSGASGSSTTNSISVNYGTSAVSGNILVKGNNAACGSGNNATLPITVYNTPGAAGTISGLTTVCQGQSGITYTVPVISEASSYQWTLPTGCSGTSATNSITVSYSMSAISGNIKVKGINPCGISNESSLSVTVNSLPSSAGTITGLSSVCQGNTNVNYSIVSIPNATSYIWTLPSGATGTSNSTSINIDYGISSLSGNITVKGSNSCGNGEQSSKAITVNSIPNAPGIVTGLTTVCQGQSNISYSIPTIPNATSYIWALPSGSSGSSSSNSISVNYGTSAISGNIMVNGYNAACGSGNNATLAVIVNNIPGSAGTISGLSVVCQGQNNVTYTVPPISDATTYQWTIPSGSSGTSSSNSITINYSTVANSGNIKVKGNNSCGFGTESSLSIYVNPLPTTAGTISGLSTVCQGNTNVNYTVANIPNATSYIWTLPSGATGISTNTSINIDFGTSASSGNITVNGNNICGNGEASSKAITVNSLPNATGNITGLANVCQGQNNVNYSISAIPNATSYTWTLPTGATGNSTTNSITINYGLSAISGTLSVKGNNSCGDGAQSTIAVTVNPLPSSAGTISGLSTLCQETMNVTYTVPVISNSTSYLWTLPNGASGMSSSDSIAINYGNTAISGNISVMGTNTCGNGEASIFPVIVNPKPTANAGNDIIVCRGDTVILSASGGINYQWNNGIIQNIPFAPEISKNYIVEVSNSYNCSDEDTVFIDVKSKTLKLKLWLQGLYSNGTMNFAIDGYGNPQWGETIADKIIIEMRENSFPYLAIETLNTNLSINGEVNSKINCLNNSTYYIVVKNRNHIETWSSSAVSFATDTINYDFTTAANKAYGNNLTQVSSGNFAIFVGDVNQDGLVDGSDMSDTETDNNNFATGYLPTDANGDGLVDGSDMSMVETNNNNFIGVVAP